MRHSRFAMLRACSALTRVADEADHLLHRVGLAAVRNKLAADLAHGPQRALEIAMVIFEVQ
jgi:ABC-type branched-subunit amino acid transport system ATPase component